LFFKSIYNLQRAPELFETKIYSKHLTKNNMFNKIMPSFYNSKPSKNKNRIQYYQLIHTFKKN